MVLPRPISSANITELYLNTNKLFCKLLRKKIEVLLGEFLLQGGNPIQGSKILGSDSDHYNVDPQH